MKKFLAIVAIVCMISGSLNAGVKCDQSCLQGHFQKPNGKNCTDIYHQCCAAFGYGHRYTTCTNQCESQYDKKRSNNEKLYTDCQSFCELKHARRLELPALKCNGKS